MASANRLHGPLDAALHLLDRQVVDCEGLMVCKVDDVELTEYASVPLKVTGLLAGSAALVRRMSGGDGEWLRNWLRLGVEQAHREQPFRIGLEDVESLGSAVRLRVRREGYLRRQGDGRPGVRRRLNDLLGAAATGPDGERLGRVLDVRLEPDRTPEGPLRVVALIVGKGRPGTLLGYDRTEEQGPWLVNWVVRRLHRHTGQIPLQDADIDWDGYQVRLHRSPDPLQPA